VTLEQSLGTQQGSLGTWFEGMQLARLDESGHPGPAFTPADCMPWQELDDASVLCSSGDFRSVTLIDATGNQKAINNALQWLAHGGRYVLVGLQKNDLIFPHPEFHKREATLMSSRNATREDFVKVMESMKKKKIDPTTYITHRVSFGQVKEEFESWLDPANGVIKAMVELG